MALGKLRWSWIVAAAWLGGCAPEERGPTIVSPTESASALATATSSRASSSRVVSGRVVDAVSGEALPGAHIEIGATRLSVSPDGSFSVALDALELVPAVVTAPGFHPRNTHMTPFASTSATIDLLPADERFDLGFFDHVFRDVGESHTLRWTEEPVFEIWTKIVDCRDGEFGECSDLFVTEQDAPGQFLQLAREVILADAPKFTGNFLTGSLVTTFDPPVGEQIAARDYLVGGRITVVLMRGYETSFARRWPWRSGRMYSASIQMNVVHKAIPFVYSHELAHALGYSHPLGSPNVPRRSVMRSYEDRPTSVDIAHGRILYSRPPGSRTVDVDPEDFAVNALRTEDGGAPDVSLIELMK